MIEKKFVGREMLFVYYKYVDRWHTRPIDFQDLFDFVDYVEVATGIERYMTALSKLK